MRKVRKWTNEVINQFLDSLGLVLVKGKDIRSHTKLTLMDAIGYYYYLSLNQLQGGHVSKIFCTYNPYTINNIKLWCKVNNKPFELLSNKYEGSNRKLLWRCLKEKCGDSFKSTWGSIYYGQGCGVCAGRQVGLSNCLAIKNPIIFKEWHPTKNGFLSPYDVTASSDKHVWWICSKNPKHEWKARIADRNKFSGCPFCASAKPYEDNNLLIHNPELCEEWNYEKNKKRPEEYLPNSMEIVWWKCKKCSNLWESTINNRNYGNGCPKCKISKGEKKIDYCLLNNKYIKIIQNEYNKLDNINKTNNKYYITWKKFRGLLGVNNGLLSYDFFLPQFNLLIEYQGEQHKRFIKGIHKTKEKFLIQLEHDRRKREYAEQNNINLLEIWYYDFNNIEQILMNKSII